MKRKLEQLNLMDDFLFGSVLSYPEIGEEFCRKLLKILMGVELEKIRVIPQKIYYGSDTDRHGTRLDVYIEDEREGTVFDVEPDKNDSAKLMEALPRRVRFYHSKIDSQSLKAGDDYSHLKRVVVIMITSYDPFGKDRILYTIRNCCKEEPDMDYDDGAATLFFYTKGKVGNVSDELRKLMNYMEESSAENADSEVLKEIHRMVETVKCDKEVSLEYMKVCEREMMIREQGEAIGELRGKSEGKREGTLQEKVRVIRKLSGMMETEKIAEIVELDGAELGRILSLIGTCPGESDEEIVSRLLGNPAPSEGVLQNNEGVLQNNEGVL